MPPLKRVVLRVTQGLMQDRFFLVLMAGLLLFSLVRPERIGSYLSLVDWPTLAALTGLLLLTKALELSGALHRLGRTLVEFMGTERAAALCLVLVAALLSTVLTNDVALFVVVPLTLSISRLTGMPSTKLIVFEALAVNVGSTLTPIGNPQNIFLWQMSRMSFGDFVWHQLPLVAAMLAALLVLTVFAFGSRTFEILEHEALPLDRSLLSVSLLLYIPFLIATDFHLAGGAALALLVLFAVLRPRVLAELDWGLLLVFVLMFIDLRLLSGLDVVKQLMLGMGLDDPGHLYLAGLGTSQLLSNVPAAIALAEFSKDWGVMLYSVNVGGFGWMVGSLANLIALRMSGERRAWVLFHLYSLPALLVTALMGYALLFLR
ncbi:MAG TPA: SLC13 family permease [Burkholderiaceae bacterium]|nr:SLC13 family permease [Burkholderiaceae bacterium]